MLLLFTSTKTHGQEKEDSIVHVAFGTVASEDLLGTVSTVNVKELLKKDYHTNILESTVGSVGGMTTNGNIWGQGPMVLVDGIPRSQYAVSYTHLI